MLSTMRVPGASGSFVFLILIGMPAFLTGKTASSWSTDAPIYESSLSSLYVTTLIGCGLSMILGSATRQPETSVQFSYMLARHAFDTIEPVISEPPLEKVTTFPSGPAP